MQIKCLSIYICCLQYFFPLIYILSHLLTLNLDYVPVFINYDTKLCNVLFAPIFIVLNKNTQILAFQTHDLKLLIMLPTAEFRMFSCLSLRVHINRHRGMLHV